MAKPVEFDESTNTHGGEGYNDLPTHVDTENDQIVSCWELSGDELAEVLQTKRIWLVVQGQTQPPVNIEGLTPFYFEGMKGKPKSDE